MRKPILTCFLSWLLLMQPAFGSFAQKTVWDVRTTGSDANGGGYDTSAGGVDHSQQDAPYITIDGTTCTGSVSSATPSVVSLSGCTPGQAGSDVGNTVVFSGGTAIPGRYRLATASTGSWTLDRNACVAGSCTAIGAMGGSLATLGQAVALFASANGGVADMKIALKSGTYAISSTIPLAALTGQNSNIIEGYQTTHGDTPMGANRPILQLTTGGGGNGLAMSVSTGGWRLANLILDGVGSQTVLVSMSNTVSSLVNCMVRNSTAVPLTGTLSWSITDSEITGIASPAGYAASFGSGSHMERNWLHDNTTTVATVTVSTNSIVAIGNLLTNNTGQGFRVGNYNVIIGNTIYRQGGAGVYGLLTGVLGTVQNNIFACVGTYGLDAIAVPANLTDPGTDYNGYHANGTGTTHYITMGSHSIQVGASGSSCTTNNPFVAPANTGAGDWSLNGTPGAGTLLRRAGFNRYDMGAYQSMGGGGGAFTFVQ